MPRRSDSSTSRPKHKVTGGIQGAAHRRRARCTRGPHHPRYAVEQANRRREQQSPTNKDTASPQIPTADIPVPTISNVFLPRFLSRPPFRLVSKETITALAPELADMPVHYIQGGLKLLGPGMLRVLMGVEAEWSSSVLPGEIDVVVNDLSSDMPTHMVAVYASYVPEKTKRRVTLFPIHNIILATYCANLPILPQSENSFPETPGSTISLPVVPLCIPAPDVFPCLFAFLYTKRIDSLLSSIFPHPVPCPVYRDDPTSEVVQKLLQRYATQLAECQTQGTLLSYAMTINSLWRNTCALGIGDKDLWCALDVAWEIIIHALAAATHTNL